MSPALTLLYARRNSCWGHGKMWWLIIGGCCSWQAELAKWNNYLQSRFARINEAEHRISAAKHNAAMWSWHCVNSCDGILPIYGFIRADLLAWGQQRVKNKVRKAYFIGNWNWKQNCNVWDLYLYTGPISAQYHHSWQSPVRSLAVQHRRLTFDGRYM